jgi:hypothetical protein
MACYTQLQFQSRLGALHLSVTVRSNDVMWGWSGIIAFVWSTIQEVVEHLLGASAVQASEALVHPAVQADFVSACGELLDPLGMMQGVPALDEEGAVQAQLSEQREQPRIADREIGRGSIRRRRAAFADFARAPHVVEGEA